MFATTLILSRPKYQFGTGPIWIKNKLLKV